MKKTRLHCYFIPAVLFGLLACNGGADDSANQDVSADRCTLSQSITAGDPDGDTSDISDITEAETGTATTDCPEGILDAEAASGSRGAMGISQSATGSDVNLVVDLGGVWPFVIASESFSGTRDGTSFLTSSPAHVAMETSCRIDSTFSGSIDDDRNMLEGTLSSTVHYVSTCP